MLILVDTSVWLEVFRAREPLDLERVVDLDDVVTCGPVAQEVLQGFRDDAPFQRARTGMRNLPWVESPMTAGVFESAADLYRTARRRGLTIRSPVDCLIAACALRNNLEVLHRDRDYAAIAQISGLRQRTP